MVGTFVDIFFLFILDNQLIGDCIFDYNLTNVFQTLCSLFFLFHFLQPEGLLISLLVILIVFTNTTLRGTIISPKLERNN